MVHHRHLINLKSSEDAGSPFHEVETTADQPEDRLVIPSVRRSWFLSKICLFCLDINLKYHFCQWCAESGEEVSIPKISGVDSVDFLLDQTLSLSLYLQDVMKVLSNSWASFLHGFLV